MMASRWRSFLIVLTLAAVQPVWALQLVGRLDSASPPKQRIEIQGKDWRLMYGTVPNKPADLPAKVTDAGDGNTWFVHGGWLRRIDSRSGRVTGRWRFPGLIVTLTPQGRQLKVELEVPEGSFSIPNQTVLFDPEKDTPPYWPYGYLLLFRIPGAETRPYRPEPFTGFTADAARKALPDLEEAIRRDSFSPYLQVIRCYLLRAMKDPRADQAFQEAARVKTDFTEYFAISADLSARGEYEHARTFFELGYRDFWERGNDPRMLTMLIGRYVLYQPFGVQPWKNTPLERRLELLDNIHRLQPNTELTPDALSGVVWKLLAADLERQGRTADALRVKERAAAATNDFWGAGLVRPLDFAALGVLAGMLGTIFYGFLLRFRYQPQKRLHQLARTPRVKSGPLNSAYWGSRERWSFVLIALLGWTALGVYRRVGEAAQRSFSMPVSVSMGGLNSPVDVPWLERLPASPERELFLAVAAQQKGQSDQAEKLYRQLPQFAESWNNLGVILKERGREMEARQAFEKALQVDPALHEAELNLGRPPADEWTKAHQLYLPGRAMLAPPASGARWRNLLSGGPSWKRVATAPLGGFAGEFSIAIALRPDVWGGGFPGEPLIWALLLALVLAIAFLPRRREVTQSPGPRFWIAELLCPGVSPSWGWLAGPATFLWCFLLIQAALKTALGTSLLLTNKEPFAPERFFGLHATEMDLVALVEPHWWWTYGPLVALAAVNAILVWRESRNKVT